MLLLGLCSPLPGVRALGSVSKPEAFLVAGCVFLPRQRWQGELGVVWSPWSRIHPFIACLAIAWVALG